MDNKTRLLIISLALALISIGNGIAGIVMVGKAFDKGPDDWSKVEEYCDSGKIDAQQCNAFKQSCGTDQSNCQARWSTVLKSLKMMAMIMVVPFMLCGLLVPCCGLAASKDVGPPNCIVISLMIPPGLAAVGSLINLVLS